MPREILEIEASPEMRELARRVDELIEYAGKEGFTIFVGFAKDLPEPGKHEGSAGAYGSFPRILQTVQDGVNTLLRSTILQ